MSAPAIDVNAVPTIDLDERLNVISGHLNALHAELVDIVKDCIRRHTQLQSRLLEAGPLFRAEQDRQAFATPTSVSGCLSTIEPNTRSQFGRPKCVGARKLVIASFSAPTSCTMMLFMSSSRIFAVR